MILFRGVCPVAQALASIYVLGVVTVYSDLVDQNGVKSQAFGTVLTQPPLECVSVSTCWVCTTHDNSVVVIKWGASSAGLVSHLALWSLPSAHLVSVVQPKGMVTLICVHLSRCNPSYPSSHTLVGSVIHLLGGIILDTLASKLIW